MATRATAKVIDKDRGYKRIRDIYRREGRKRLPHVLMGFRGDGKAGQNHQTGGSLTVAEIASIHEFGLGNNPERSILRAAFDAHLNEYIDIATNLAGQMVDGLKTLRQSLEILGLKAQADAVDRILSRIPPPLVVRVGGVPLKDTGQLSGSIDFKVVGA